MKVIILMLFVGFSTFAFQQDFEGVIKYKIEYPPAMIETLTPELQDLMKLTTKTIKKDRMTTETWTKMGKQVLIEKIGSDTSYLLMNLMGTDLALIMVNPNPGQKKNDSLEVVGKSPKLFERKCKKAKYFNSGKEYEITFTTEISSAYGNSFQALDGLALVFPIVIGETDVLYFTCTSIEEKPVSDTAFDIPSKYKLTTMEEFGKLIGG